MRAVTPELGCEGMDAPTFDTTLCRHRQLNRPVRREFLKLHYPVQVLFGESVTGIRGRDLGTLQV